MSSAQDFNIPATMQGVQLIKYGLPSDSLSYNKEITVPKIKNPNQVLIRVKAAGMNPAEVKASSGNIRLGTFMMSFPCVIGGDFAGIIMAKGDNVSDFQIGDEVYGTQPLPFGMDGTYSQYTVVDITKSAISIKPNDLSFEHAASAGIAVLTAYEGIVNNCFIRDDDVHEIRKIIVIGASGGVGSFAVQIAKAVCSGNTVIGICSDKNTEFVKSLGADQVIDYKNKEAYNLFIETTGKGSVDIIFDCVGGDEYFNSLEPLLKENGVYSSAVGPIDHIGSSYIGITTAFSMLSKVIYKKLFAKHRYSMVSGIPFSQLKTKITPLFESKKIRAPIYDLHSVYKLESVIQAHEKIISHRTVGKLVISVD